ncbi:MAG: hypothetical protein DRP54_05600 [Spirochaetes bacterium]|nr:MAG: hypothetical protein DRP54_05600 [Spirochaetota bacterium]
MKRRKAKLFLLKTLLTFLALGLIPLFTIFILNFKILFQGFEIFRTEVMWVVMGFMGYLGFFIIAGPPKKIYILEHELTHAIGALLSGVKIKDFRIKGGSGYIKTERVNIFIALLPYVFPLYTFLTILLFYIYSVFESIRFVNYIFYFLFGLSLSFHTSATFYYLMIDQPDLRRYGVFPSIIFILLWYVIIISILLYMLMPELDITEFFKKSLSEYFAFYNYLIYKIFS